MSKDIYIKLSRVREDYGIGDRKGDVLYISELDHFGFDQLKSFRLALRDEIEDIKYQIEREKKYLERDASWMYSCKNSLKARQKFVDKIDELLGDSYLSSEYAKKFMQVAKDHLNHEVYNLIISKVSDMCEDDLIETEDVVTMIESE